MTIIEKKILDRRFTNLIRKALKAGYFQFRKFNRKAGTPPLALRASGGSRGTGEDSIISPILANIYLHQLDEFVLKLKKDFDLGQKPGITEESKLLEQLFRKAKRQGDSQEMKKIMKERRKISYTDFRDPSYKRLSYIRYADD